MIVYRIAGITIGIDHELESLVPHERFSPFLIAKNEMYSSFDMRIMPQDYLCDSRVADNNNRFISSDIYTYIASGYLVHNVFGALVVSAFISEDYSFMSLPPAELVGKYGQRFLESFFCRLLLQTFRRMLLKHNSIQLHSSAIMFQERAIVFSGISGVGKSTQAELWRRYECAEIINQDSPILKLSENSCVAYGNPWSGSDICYKNMSAPVVALLMLTQAKKCDIIQLDIVQSVRCILLQSLVLCRNTLETAMLAHVIENIAEIVPIYSLKCTPNLDAVNYVKAILFP